VIYFLTNLIIHFKKQLVLQDDIVYELKAVKNPTEIEGMKQAHVTDSILSLFFIDKICV
jgi:Xaa-Pro aminopeptidase